MCIFSGAVDKVNATKIFSCCLSDGKQFTCYSNDVQLADNKPVAMILPLPNPTGASDQIDMFDMSKYANFYDELEKAFPKGPTPQSNGRGLRSLAVNSLLEIKSCGPYDYSVAPTFDDLKKIEWTHFALDPAVQELLQAHYVMGFGFLVCICKRSGSFAPVGIIHPRLESGDLFVPTMHAHGGPTESKPDWDHRIYVHGTGHSANKMTTSLGQAIVVKTRQAEDLAHLDYSILPKGFPQMKEEDTSFVKCVITGTQANGDLVFPAGGASSSTQ